MRRPRGQHGSAQQPQALGSLGLSAVVHAAVIGALFGVGLQSASEAPTWRRTIVVEAPPSAGLVEPAAPADLPAEPREQLEPLPDDPLGPTDFADDWVTAPEPLELDEDLWRDEPLEVVPVAEWSDERLARHSSFEVRPLDPDVIAITPAPEQPEPAVAQPEAADPPSEPAPTADAATDGSDAPDALPAPARLEGSDPEYPAASQRRREEGDVTLRLALDAEGRVVLVELESSSGHRRLDQAVMSAAPEWRFDLTGIDEAARARGFLHTVRFRLSR